MSRKRTNQGQTYYPANYPAPRQAQYPPGYPPRLQKPALPPAPRRPALPDPYGQVPHYPDYPYYPEPRQRRPASPWGMKKDGIHIPFPWADSEKPKQKSRLEPGDTFIFCGIMGLLLFILASL